MNTQKLFHRGALNVLIAISLAFIIGACTKDNDESDRSRAVRLLTNNSSKPWMMEQNLIDNVEQKFDVCDSSYVLTIHSDFTWKEAYQNISCSSGNFGSWDLNDENNVLTTYYKPFLSLDFLERKFEILELTETTFSYQYASRNSLIVVKLKKF